MLVNKGVWKNKQTNKKTKQKNQNKPKTKTTKIPTNSKRNKMTDKQKLTKITILKIFRLGASFKLIELIDILEAPHLKKKLQISWI